MNPTLSPLIHLIDDDDAVRSSLALLISTVGLRVQGWGEPQQFLREFDRAAIGAIVLDVRMPGISGLAVLEQLVQELRNEIHVPARFRDARSNKSLESLTMSPDGRFLYTTSEAALERDHPLLFTCYGIGVLTRAAVRLPLDLTPLGITLDAQDPVQRLALDHLVLHQPVGEHAAGGTGSHDDVVVHPGGLLR